MTSHSIIDKPTPSLSQQSPSSFTAINSQCQTFTYTIHFHTHPNSSCHHISVATNPGGSTFLQVSSTAEIKHTSKYLKLKRLDYQVGTIMVETRLGGYLIYLHNRWSKAKIHSYYHTEAHKFLSSQCPKGPIILMFTSSHRPEDHKLPPSWSPQISFILKTTSSHYAEVHKLSSQRPNVFTNLKSTSSKIYKLSLS